METIKEAGKAISEGVQEVGSKLSYEGNKATAKDSSNSAGTRVGAAVDAVGDKVSEKGHAASKEAHKEKAAH